MHIVVSTIPLSRQLGPEEIARLEQDLPAQVAGRPGYRGVYWARTDQADQAEALTVSIWDSPADADAAFAAIGPWLGSVLGPLMAGAPQRRVAEVVVHHVATTS